MCILSIQLWDTFFAITDSPNVKIANPRDWGLRLVLWFQKGDKKGHATGFNVFIFCGYCLFLVVSSKSF